jgi:hypothetical protein
MPRPDRILVLKQLNVNRLDDFIDGFPGADE